MIAAFNGCPFSRPKKACAFVPVPGRFRTDLDDDEVEPGVDHLPDVRVHHLRILGLVPPQRRLGRIGPHERGAVAPLALDVLVPREVMHADERALRREPRADLGGRQVAFDPVAQARGVPARRVPAERLQ